MYPKGWVKKKQTINENPLLYIGYKKAGLTFNGRKMFQHNLHKSKE